MPGALMQLAAVGAQNELVNGNPSMTHFRTVYRRHTNFAMEHIRLTFASSHLEFDMTGARTLTCRIDRYGQLVNDCYLVLTLPDIWSPLKPVVTAPTGYDQRCTAIGYEFQWIKNIGYNLIDRIELTANGQVLQTMTGEYLKLYSHCTHDQTKRAIVDKMVGHVKEMYDPANAFDRNGQYPHAVAVSSTSGLALPMTTVPEPSIRSRQLIVPLHFWFCESAGTALPLVSMQNTDVFINVVLNPLVNLYTIVDTNPVNTTYGKRIRPDASLLPTFLSPPLLDGTPTNPTLSSFFPDPYIEANFISLTEMELNQLALADQTVLMKEVIFVGKENQYGPNTETVLPARNLVTRILFSARRSDMEAANNWDNYTNWDSTERAPFTANSSNVGNVLYSSGQYQVSSVSPRDTMTDSVLLFNGVERFYTKPSQYFSLLQSYRHTTGPSLPGVYMYSFALNNDQYQPSGALNASLIDKLTLRMTLQQPLPEDTATGQTQVCVLRSTVFNQNPTVIPPGQIGLYDPSEVVTVIQNVRNGAILFKNTYNVSVYIESYNFLRIVSGLANLVFAS
jgi:hypothetical protein